MRGSSAGGNLTRAAAQLSGIMGRFPSFVPFYPVADSTGVYEGEYRTTKHGKPAQLKDLGPAFDWSYIPKGQGRFGNPPESYIRDSGTTSSADLLHHRRI